MSATAELVWTPDESHLTWMDLRIGYRWVASYQRRERYVSTIYAHSSDTVYLPVDMTDDEVRRYCETLVRMEGAAR